MIRNIFKVFLLYIIITHFRSNCNPCNLRQFDNGFVCVCNETYCDNLELPAINTNQFLLVSSSKDGHRFKISHGNFTNNEAMKKTKIVVQNRLKTLPESLQCSSNVRATLTINRSETYQTIMGFGGAYTGSVTHLMNKASQMLQDFVYRSFYCHTTGIGYNFMRIPIGGSDFDLAPWAYNEYPRGDAQLSNFTKLDERDLQRIEQIKQLKNVSKNYDIRFVGAAWTSPRWMKTNPEWSSFNELKPEYYQAWAKYHLKYLELMKAQNISFWGISTGNEPFNAIIAWLFVRFVDLGWIATNQGKWLGNFLGPLLRNSEFQNLKLLGLDDQRYQLAWWFDDMNKGSPNSTNYLDGIAVHWYRDKIFPTTLLDHAHAKYPDKFILNTESSIVGTPLLGSWSRAERYIKGYMEDLEHWVNGWIDWNLIVDEIGGPNYARNYVDAPIIMNATNNNEIYKQPIFYAIGHFSRFVVVDSIRIFVSSSHNDIMAIGFKRPDKSVSLNIYNKSNCPAEILINDDDAEILLKIPSKSIHTLIYF